jgi:hypothetical protein
MFGGIPGPIGGTPAGSLGQGGQGFGGRLYGTGGADAGIRPIGGHGGDVSALPQGSGAAAAYSATGAPAELAGASEWGAVGTAGQAAAPS